MSGAGEGWTCDKCKRPMKALDEGRRGFAHVSVDDAFTCGVFRPPTPRRTDGLR